MNSIAPAAPELPATPAPHARGAHRLPPGELRELSRLRPGVALAHVAAEWLGIAAAVALCEAFWHPLVYASAVVWIGARLHALGILAHDGAHFLILPNRRWNDWVTRLFLAWPVGMSFESYRRVHGLHHRFLNTERDPDWARNRPDRLRSRRGPLAFARIMLGLNGEQRTVLEVFGSAAGSGRARRIGAVRALYYLAIVAIGFAVGRPDALLLYWAVPLFSWFLVTMRLKGTAEHFAVDGHGRYDRSRTVHASFLERLLIAPKNVHFHIEHHLHPSVPFYRLPELHRRLMARPGYRARAHLTRSYWAYLRECLAANRAAAG
jgi:fatty acid desaturase